MSDAFGRLGNRVQNVTSQDGLQMVNSEMTQSRSELHSVRDTEGPLRQTSFDQRAMVFAQMAANSDPELQRPRTLSRANYEGPENKAPNMMSER